MAAVTLKDVASKLNLSITTVSRALAGYSDVAAATRKRVQQTAEEMGYVPQITARRLQKGRTDTIGLIVPTYASRFSDPFFTEFLAGVGNKAVEHEVDLLVSTRPPGPDELKVYKRMVMERRVDGLLLISTRPSDPRVAYLLERNFPFVAFGRSDLDANFPYLDVDGEDGMRRKTEHLISLGHHRIAYISGPFDLMYSSHRLAGYRAALTSAGLPIESGLITVSDFSERGGYGQAHTLLTRADRPTAIIAGNDAMASGAINAAQELGLTVGKDVAVTGFDDIPPAEYARPALTTIRQPAYEAGWQVTDMLIRMIRGESLSEHHILLKPELIIRESSRGRNNRRPTHLPAQERG